jgi:hypothetical protein
MAKIKVTRRTHIRKPWYERPAVLFAALAVALILGGLLLARLFSARQPEAFAPTLGGTPTPAAQETAPSPATPPSDELGGVLPAGSPLPASTPGAVLPPVRVLTHAEAAAARRALRQASSASPESGARFVEGAKLAGLASLTWDALPLREEGRAFCDFEVLREAGGSGTLVGFVTLDEGKALADLGPSFALPAEGDEPPGWQIWRRRDTSGRVRLHAGSRITFYPDLDPVATCIVALPLERLRPLRMRRADVGLAQPVEALEIELR